MNSLQPLFPASSCEPAAGSQVMQRALGLSKATSYGGSYGFDVASACVDDCCDVYGASMSSLMRLKAMDVRVSSEAAATSGVGGWDAVCSQSREVRRKLVYGLDEAADTSGPVEEPHGSWVIRWLEDSETRVPMVTIPALRETWTDAEAWVPSESHDGPWLLVVPLWTDVENAVPGDLVLDASETTTGVTWRAAFRHQTTLPEVFLGESLGWLTESGAEVFAAALDGLVAPERTGSALESEFDPRLSADEWIEAAIAGSLQQLHADSSEDDDDWFLDEEPAVGAQTVPEFVPLAGVVHLRPRFVSAKRDDFALAAAPLASASDECVLESRELGEGFLAKLRVDWRTDELRMEVVKAPPEISGSEVVIAVSAAGREPVTATGRIVLGDSIVLSRHEAIDQWDVEFVELRLK